MIKNKKNATSGKRRTNPLEISKLGSPGRVRLNFDGQILNAIQFFTPMTTVGNFAAGVYLCDASNLNAAGFGPEVRLESSAKGLVSVTGLYNEYVYRSVTFQWIPSVAPGVAEGASQINIGYIDNPEEMAGLSGIAGSSLFTLSKALRNTKTFNAWERFSYTVPLSRRNKVFNVNSGIAFDTNVFQRSVQGCVLVGAASISSAATLGQFKATYSIELRTMNFLQST